MVVQFAQVCIIALVVFARVFTPAIIRNERIRDEHDARKKEKKER